MTSPDRRNPARLIVSKESQLRILSLVSGGVFFCMAAALAIAIWVEVWVWTVALVLVVGSFTALWVSRQIAGPFYRIEKDLEAVLSGANEGKAIRLRPGDPLHHLVQLINELIVRKQG